MANSPQPSEQPKQELPSPLSGPLDLSSIQAPSVAGGFDSNKLPDVLTSINNFSASLKGSLYPPPIQAAFDSVLGLQTAIKGSALAMETIGAATKVVNGYMATAVAPMDTAVANVGLFNANSAGLFNAGQLTATQLAATTRISGIALDAIKATQGLSFPTATLHAPVLSSLASGVATGVDNRLFGSGIATAVQAMPTYPHDFHLATLEIARRLSAPEPEQVSHAHHQLDDLLREIDPELVDYRRGCWATFEKRGPDYIGQATSSMRRVVDGLLRVLAPKDEVKARRPASQVSDKPPTRRERMIYILGSDRAKSEKVDRVIKSLLDAHDNLSAWDHVPDRNQSFVRGILIAVEGLLISFLTLGSNNK